LHELKVFFIDVKFGRWVILITCIHCRIYRTVEEEISPSLTYSISLEDTGKLRHSHTTNWIRTCDAIWQGKLGPSLLVLLQAKTNLLLQQD